MRVLDSHLADNGLDSQRWTGTEPCDQESVAHGIGSKSYHMHQLYEVWYGISESDLDNSFLLKTNQAGFEVDKY